MSWSERAALEAGEIDPIDMESDMIRPAPTAPADWSWVRMGFRAGVSKSGSGFTGMSEF